MVPGGLVTSFYRIPIFFLNYQSLNTSRIFVDHPKITASLHDYCQIWFLIQELLDEFQRCSHSESPSLVCLEAFVTGYSHCSVTKHSTASCSFSVTIHTKNDSWDADLTVFFHVKSRPKCLNMCNWKLIYEVFHKAQNLNDLKDFRRHSNNLGVNIFHRLLFYNGTMVYNYSAIDVYDLTLCINIK